MVDYPTLTASEGDGMPSSSISMEQAIRETEASQAGVVADSPMQSIVTPSRHRQRGHRIPVSQIHRELGLSSTGVQLVSTPAERRGAGRHDGLGRHDQILAG